MAHGLSDTSKHVQAVQDSILRQMSVAQRGTIALSLSHTVLTLSRRAFRQRHPGMSEQLLLSRIVSFQYALPLMPPTIWRYPLTPPNLTMAYHPVVTLFNVLGIEYHFGGAFASSIHGRPRATIACDLVAHLIPDHIPIVVAELSSQFSCSETEIQDALTHDTMFPSFNLIHRTMGIKITVFVPPPSPYLQSRLERSVTVAFDEQTSTLTVRVAAVEDMILTKLLWYEAGNRTSDRQWGDIVGMLAIQQATVDWDYLRDWAASLDITELLHLATVEATH